MRRNLQPPALRLLLPLLHILLWLVRALLRLCLRFLHPILSLFVLYNVYVRVHECYASKLGGGWPPAFPVYRIAYILTLAIIPIWGGVMAGVLAAWTGGAVLWAYVWRRTRGRRYAPLANVDVDMDMADLGASGGIHENGDNEHGRASRRVFTTPTANGTNPKAGPASERWSVSVPRLGWFALWGAYVALALFGAYMLQTYELPIDHRFKKDVEQAVLNPKRGGHAANEKIYIAAMFYDNGPVLPYWIQEVTKLIHYLGPENIFLSIVESNSHDNSPALLNDFAASLSALRVPHKVIVGDTSVERPSDVGTGFPRIDFLAAVRNLVMQPLIELAEGTYSETGNVNARAPPQHFSRVVWSNDVFIEAEFGVLGVRLRSLHSWVIRDRLGRIGSTLWPYFLEDTGYNGVMADLPAPVFACWNGIVAVRAEPFLPPALRLPGSTHLSTAPLARPLVSTHPLFGTNSTPFTTPALRFRSSAPGECFSSESFDLPYDLSRVYGLAATYVNPRAINSYNWDYYVYWKYVTRHWAVKWFIETVENGKGVHLAKMILGDPAKLWKWDGGECHPANYASSALQVVYAVVRWLWSHWRPINVIDSSHMVERLGQALPGR
ncbi:cryptococcal mannosyltransferase 1-domain-containing protein [Mycena rebaudengoi]|nr:cryptococcal mannosyltransferase 1-domain-containing protein [Mycena rebaudengoi]